MILRGNNLEIYNLLFFKGSDKKGDKIAPGELVKIYLGTDKTIFWSYAYF